ncbi:alpha/beta hydrolase [Oceanobacillus bengalensis]|uniref:alpha/beta hydrolase n=3 Tax=Oceanobacillus bengalensis TaxID=1435466 RepID=UPI001603BB1E|nr:alpha/beta hydrolase [Oceanobacillus bengalensis]
MAWVSKDDVNIHYEKIDSENPAAVETLILIHGVGLDMHSWDLIIPYFVKDYSILRYDLRGHGGSDAGKGKRDVKLLTDDLLYLLTELDIGPYHIVAQGFGGFLGVLLATFEEKRDLKSLILMGVPIHYPKEIGDHIAEERKAVVAGQDSMLEIGKQLVKKVCYRPSKEIVNILLHAYKQVKPNVYFELFHPGFGAAAMENLQRIDVPILILSGSEDEIFPPEITSALLNFNHFARFFTVPYASFLIQMDQPVLVSQWIHEFIEKNKVSQRDIISPEAEFKRNLTSQMYSDIRGMLKDRDEPLNHNELQVNIMNGFSVRLNGEKIADGWGKRKAKQLLMYLVIKHSATRDELCDVFWPEVSLLNARNRLRVSLHHLKHVLETSPNINPILVAGREYVLLQGIIHSDLISYVDSIKCISQVKSEPFRKLILSHFISTCFYPFFGFFHSKRRTIHV